MLCFVAQPFRDPYDQRFKDVYAPALREAGLEPYRVDTDPGVSIIIDTIEEKIREADFVFADITEDNPSVYFEVGYARSQNKPLILVRERRPRRRLPFDIQHRLVIYYGTGSPTAYEDLRSKITARANALKKEIKPRTRSQSVEAYLERVIAENVTLHASMATLETELKSWAASESSARAMLEMQLEERKPENTVAAAIYGQGPFATATVAEAKALLGLD